MPTYIQALRDMQQVCRYGCDRNVLVENELFTPREFEKYRLHRVPNAAEVFREVKVPKGSTYFFFGARFSVAESAN